MAELQRYSAVIFDMDGVLIDSEPLHFAVLREVLARDGHTLTPTENEEFMGVTSEAMFSTLVARHALPRSVADYVARYDAALLSVLEQPHAPAPGVLALVEQLRSLQVRLGVASSSRRIWVSATLRSIGLSDAFETVVSGNDVARGKPDPSIYLLAASQLGVTPECCLAIEDSPNGVLSARAAGMAVLGVRTPYTAHLQLQGVVRVVDSLADFEVSAEVFGPID